MADGFDDRLDTDQYEGELDYDRPSLGQRIGAKTPIQPTPEAASAKDIQTQKPDALPSIQIDPGKLPAGIMPTTNTTTPAKLSPSLQPPDIKFDPQKLPSGILRTTPTPGEIPSPTASSPATTTLPGLMQKRSDVAQPITALDPTGSAIPKYRMGVSGKILGTLANAAMGFSGRGGDPIYVGRGALNNRYYSDVQRQQEQLKGLDTDIANQEKLAGLEEKGYEGALKQAFEASSAESRQETAEAR